MTFRASLSAALPALVFLISCFPVIQAQETSEKAISQPRPAASPGKSRAQSKSDSAAATARLEQQKALAVSLLITLADDVRNFSDQRLKARTQARIADALWDADMEQGRDRKSVV